MRDSTNAEKRAALMAATFAAFLTPFLGAALNVALPTIGQEFNANAIMSSVERKHLGVASGAVGTMRMIGQMLSMSIVLILFSVLIGKIEISPEVYGAFLKSMHIAFTLFAVLCFGGVFASVARGKLDSGR